MTVKIDNMDSIPAHANPFHYDMESMGIQINERFVAMFLNYRPDELVIVDTETGKRVKLNFPPPAKKEIQFKDVSPKRPGISKWVDIKA